MKAPPTLITKEQAKARGRKLYFTGEPCQHGHVCERFVRRAWCVECARLGNKPEAKPAKKYFTGEPCKHGHISERYAANGNCVECSKEQYQKWNSRQQAARA
jgi:hypothetical protein